MPPTQRGQAYKVGAGRWGLRYFDTDGVRRRKSSFPSKSAALAHYRDVIEPRLRGDPVPMAELTLSEFVDLYLERQGTTVRPERSRRSGSACGIPSARSGPSRCGNSSA